MPGVAKYRRGRGLPLRLHVRGLPDFGHGSRDEDQAYRVIEDEEVLDQLQEYERNGVKAFTCVPADELEAALESEAEAVEAIDAGEYDDVLDLLLYAEREVFGGRTTVISTISTRSTELKQQQADAGSDVEGGPLRPEDLAVGG